MEACLIRLRGITAHFRDPRINTAKIGLPARTLRCPPPCTVHGLLCAAKGGWVEPSTLEIGWRLDYDSIAIDFQTSRLPQRKEYASGLGIQKTNVSPVEREFLVFPTLSMLCVSGVSTEWFRRPANPLSLGRSEDLIVEKAYGQVEIDLQDNAEIMRQCLPLVLGTGTVYAAPLYFQDKRSPVEMDAKVDAVVPQKVGSLSGSQEFASMRVTGEQFYVWKFAPR
jgi:CRISPR-associated Cas5-like protein